MFLLLAWLAVGAGHAACRWMPWNSEEISVHLRTAVAIAVAPILLGVLVVAVLWLLPGRSHATHLAVIFAAATMAGGAGWITAWRGRLRAGSRPMGGTMVALLLVGYAVVLIADAALLPLVQNDALEYATVGRILFDSRDLASYPAIRPGETASGFYGPWTHPPLYVALIYVANLLQGEASSARLLRFLAPWCLLSAALCVGALGRLLERDRGALAAVITVSVPLLYLGAAAALIDPLAVLGFTLAFAAAVVLAGRGLRGAVAFGVLLGLSLWTHSQAILFPFLTLPLILLHVLPEGRLGWALRRAVALGTVAVAVALAVGAAPYVRNQLLFGSPISDTPAVFALPSLDWAGYFASQRGFSTTAEVVQYGVLKGLFAPEAYSITFWVGLVGVPAAWRSTVALASGSAALRGSHHVIAAGALWCCAIYLFATIVSVCVGVDLMVRNERYLLVMIPCAALLAVGSLGWQADAGDPGRVDGGSSPSRRRLFAVLAGLFGLQLLVLSAYRVGQFEHSKSTSVDGALAGWAPYRAASYLKNTTPPNAVVLSMKPADMYYADRRMLSYLDPRLLHFYQLRDPEVAAAELRRLGVTHLHLPDYMLPPMYNSTLMALAADERHFQLVHDDGGYQVLEMVPVGEAKDVGVSCEVRLADLAWTRDDYVVVGGRKNLLYVELGRRPYVSGTTSTSWNSTPFFLRESLVRLTSAPVEVRSDGDHVLVELAFKGEGYVAVYGEVRDRHGRMIERRLLGDVPLAPTVDLGVLRRALQLPAGATSLAVSVEHRGRSWIEVAQPRLRKRCQKVSER